MLKILYVYKLMVLLMKSVLLSVLLELLLKKKKLNKSGYPDEAIKTLARCFYPSMVEFFNSEEGQREYEEWLKEQESLQALPVAA